MSSKSSPAPALAAMAAFVLFLFSRTTGNLTIKTDDIWFLSHTYVGGGGYLGIMASRGYLTRFYSFVHDTLGGDLQRTHLFYFLLLLVSAWLFYRLAVRLLPSRSAVVATLFYTAYAGKFETVTWISAGAYLVLMIVFFVSAWIAIVPRWGNWSKALLITLLNWLAVHLYEFLIIAGPLYPALYWLHARWRGRRVRLAELAPTSLPLVMFLLHALLMYQGRPNNPLWMRDPSWAAGPLASLWNTFKLGFSSSMAYYHAAFLALRLRDFWYSPWTVWMWVSFFTAVACFIWFWRSRTDATRIKAKDFRLLLVAGCYLVLVTPLVAFPIVSVHFPERLLSLPSVGLALLAGLAIGWPRPRWRGLLVAGVMVALTLEAVAFNTILAVNEINWAYDSGIRRQLQETGLRIPAGSAVFLSLPDRHPAWGQRRVGEGTWEIDQGQLLLALDNGLVGTKGTLAYYWERREASGATRFSLPAEWLAKPDKVFPFLVRQSDYKLVGIRRAEFAGGTAIEFPRVAHLPDSMVVKVAR